MALYTFDVWKDMAGWQFCNRYHIFASGGSDEQGPIANALVDAEKEWLEDRATIEKVNVAPVPDPGGGGFVPYLFGVTGQLNFSGNPQAPPEICLWVSMRASSGLLGRKSYRCGLVNTQVQGGTQKPRYVGTPAVLTALATEFTTLLETIDGLGASLRIGVDDVTPTGRVVESFSVRTRPIAVKVNKAWYNRTPAP